MRHVSSEPSSADVEGAADGIADIGDSDGPKRLGSKL